MKQDNKLLDISLRDVLGNWTPMARSKEQQKLNK